MSLAKNVFIFIFLFVNTNWNSKRSNNVMWYLRDILPLWIRCQDFCKHKIAEYTVPIVSTFSFFFDIITIKCFETIFSKLFRWNFNNWKTSCVVVSREKINWKMFAFDSTIVFWFDDFKQDDFNEKQLCACLADIVFLCDLQEKLVD